MYAPLWGLSIPSAGAVYPSAGAVYQNGEAVTPPRVLVCRVPKKGSAYPIYNLAFRPSTLSNIQFGCVLYLIPMQM